MSTLLRIFLGVLILIPTQSFAAVYSLTYDLVYRIHRDSDYGPTNEMIENGFPVIDYGAVLRDSFHVKFSTGYEEALEFSCTFDGGDQGSLCPPFSNWSYYYFDLYDFDTRTGAISFTLTNPGYDWISFDLRRGGPSTGTIRLDHEWFADCFGFGDCPTNVNSFSLEVLGFRVEGLPRPPHPVPVPATLPLLASVTAALGFGGIAFRGRRTRR